VDTNSFFILSYVGLWALVLFLYVAVYLLYRYIGLQQQSETGRSDSVKGLGTDTYGPQLLERADLTLTTIHGNTLRLGENGDRPYVILFAADDCPACMRVRNTFAQVARQFPAIGVIVVYVGVPANVQAFVRRMPHSAVGVADPDNDLGRSWRIQGRPFLVAVDSHGIIRKKGQPGSPRGLSGFFMVEGS
jgi:thiol-disulfide isomerase/thioredoxin